MASSSIAVWQYVELRAAERRIEELEAGEDGGGFLGGLGDTFEEAFGDAFEEGLGSLGGGAGDLAACLLPDEPFSATPAGDLPLPEQIAAIADSVERLRGLEF